MNIQHILWERPQRTGKERGLLDLTITLSDGHEERVTVQGTLDHDTQSITLTGGFKMSLPEDAVSVFLSRVGTIVEEGDHA